MICEIQLENIIEYAQSVIVYRDGIATCYGEGSGEFKEICAVWTNMLDGAHEMPAFGVSLNGETVKAMRSGVWLEFVFGETLSSNGMPFDKLLVNVCAGYSGFNIIRYNAARGYDGRCFYYDLVEKDMTGLYTLLTEKL